MNKNLIQYSQMVKSTNGQMDKWTNEQMDKWTNEQIDNICLYINNDNCAFY